MVDSWDSIVPTVYPTLKWFRPLYLLSGKRQLILGAFRVVLEYLVFCFQMAWHETQRLIINMEEILSLGIEQSSKNDQLGG